VFIPSPLRGYGGGSVNPSKTICGFTSHSKCAVNIVMFESVNTAMSYTFQNLNGHRTGDNTTDMVVLV